MHAIPPHLLPESRRKPVKAAIDGFTNIPLLLVPDKQAAALDRKKLRKTEARIGDRIYPALTPHLGTVTYTRDEEEHAKLHYEEQELRNHNLAYVKDVAQDLSRLTGLTVHLHSPKAVRVEPLPAKPDEFHVIFGAIPTGPFRALNDIDKVFGQTLDNKAWYFRRIEPVKGRGLALYDPEDKDKKSIVQMVSRTGYMLIPVLSVTNRGAVAKIFRGLLNLVFQGLSQTAKHKAKRISSSQTFAKHHLAIREESHDWRKDRIKEQEVAAEKALKDYQRALEDLRFWKFVDQADSDENRKAVRAGSARQDYARIRNMAEVERIEFVDEGLHVVTRVISAQFDGKSYRLGRYAIRIARDQFSLFCTESCHPKGIIHPHYPTDGVPCWGNAGIPITRAYQEGRLGDFVELVIKWLTQGYEPALADTKIEEWPHAS
ncbi:hypothetical protein IT407_05185 [Candidatus Uhrbacteria bacterium]|nr:hypothetical protein [Candidatus Uhrbacteria bacterium]